MPIDHNLKKAVLHVIALLSALKPVLGFPVSEISLLICCYAFHDLALKGPSDKEISQFYLIILIVCKELLLTLIWCEMIFKSSNAI